MTAYTSVPGAIGVLGTGSYLPGRPVPNAAIAHAAGVTAEWIERKTGICARHYAAEHEAASDLAARAAVRALDNASIAPAELRWIIVATSTPDQPQPATAALVQHRLGAYGAVAFDVNAVCAGFVAGLHTAAHLASDGYALVIGVDVYSRILDRSDRRTAPLFGDGAGAVVIGPVPPDRGLIGTGLRTDGHLHDLIGVAAGGSRTPASHETVACGGHWFRMRGRDVRDYVVRELPALVHGVLDACGVSAAEVEHFIPHQANGVMLVDIWDMLGLSAARQHLLVRRHGNTGAASIPVTLDHAHRWGALTDGQLVMLAAFGGGMTAGATLLRWTT